ncbi:hypothetical protein MKO06_15555 [Gramella sp. GC03-9]|uniref:Uncharacterized protein n=1 Tax=Christiangramia oceanisediminis TaxID=2920386 RepID=A0A9X2RDI1_9FLAO|nr:hypothetical protein [Gramella oceanisediminis]MCP9201325.1 hypothetical protein [Gramella oceanisediminis]
MINFLLDKYYKRPLLYDLIFTGVILSIIYICENKFEIELRLEENANNLGAIGLTVSGFILTLLTILLTVKSNTIIRGDKIDEKVNAFQVFLASPLYSKSIRILKSGVLILLFVSFITLALATLGKNLYQSYGFYINVVCLIFILLTFLRCFHIINLILDMQNNKLKN